MIEFDPSNYRIAIQRKNVEGHPYFVGSVSEFPDIEVYEDTFADAYKAIIGILADLKETAEENGNAFPTPSVSSSSFNGRITLRVPRWLHQRLDLQARQEDVSLNSHLTTLLTEGSTRLLCHHSEGLIINPPVVSHHHLYAPGNLSGVVFALSDTQPQRVKVVREISTPAHILKDLEEEPMQVRYMENFPDIGDTLNKREIAHAH